MKHVEIYTTPTCPYCIVAKRLLTKKGVDFTEIDMAADPAQQRPAIAIDKWNFKRPRYRLW